MFLRQVIKMRRVAGGFKPCTNDCGSEPARDGGVSVNGDVD
ncbi:hypothetical protein BN844_5379 [Pseudomonas sp. SHC52]|nr:hypothetical protein BN844_5379 [Pseudomonas sp. SHC52]